eukprot:COSAG05_NODE_6576_length_936_cov_1.091995_2_plen_64_part_01
MQVEQFGAGEPDDVQLQADGQPEGTAPQAQLKFRDAMNRAAALRIKGQADQNIRHIESAHSFVQ